MRQGLSKDLIERVLGEKPRYTIAELEKKFPLRNLPKGAFVTRFAPSPTGYMHIGGLYSALIDYKLALDSGGVFILRIEDTDTKRKVSDAVKIIMDSMSRFGLKYDNDEKYGPYSQSRRKDIYLSVMADLLARGLAYPCFLTMGDMEKIRSRQRATGFATGIYGEFARDRNITESEIIAHLNKGEIPAIRLYSTGNPDKKIICRDIIRGAITFPENNEDIVLIKSNDRLPTYHFAHLVDDHFMRITHVVRGAEWLTSLPLHIALFNAMGWNPPFYIHTSTIDKLDEKTGKQRKLSKRLDQEANVEFFLKEGWPAYAVLEYLGNIASSGYEEAKTKGQIKTFWDYKLNPKKIPISGALFDMKKLEWWAKEFIASTSTEKLVAAICNWVGEFGSEKNKKQVADKNYLIKILSIERDNPKRVRKDFITWKQTLNEIEYFWDDLFVPNKEYKFNKELLSAFLKMYDPADDRDTWWNKIVKIATDKGVTGGEVAMNLRVALVGRTTTPDLYSVMSVMGAQKVKSRIKDVINDKK